MCKGPCSYVCTDGSGRAFGVGAYARLLPTKSDPRETSGPRIDRIPPTRPPWWDRQYRDIKKLIFSPPSKCPIVLSGPVANGTILKQMHGVFCIKLLNGFSKARKIQRTLPKSHMDGRMAAPRTRMMPSTPLNAEMLKGKT